MLIFTYTHGVHAHLFVQTTHAYAWRPAWLGFGQTKIHMPPGPPRTPSAVRAFGQPRALLVQPRPGERPATLPPTCTLPHTLHVSVRCAVDLLQPSCALSRLCGPLGYHAVWRCLTFLSPYPCSSLLYSEHARLRVRYLARRLPPWIIYTPSARLWPSHPCSSCMPDDVNGTRVRRPTRTPWRCRQALRSQSICGIPVTVLGLKAIYPLMPCMAPTAGLYL